MCRFFKSLLLLLTVMSPCLHAEIMEREVRSVGVSAQQAISNGLVEVLRQTQGVAIQSEKVAQRFQQEINLQVGENELNSSAFAENVAGKVRYKTAGVVQQYDVLSIEQRADLLYEAHLLVKTEVYKTPGFSPKNRRRLAVLPLQVGDGYFRFGKTSIASTDVASRVQQAIISTLTQARRFSVMDRDSTAAYQREKALISSGNTPASEYAKLGQVLGVDYLVVGIITDAGVQQKRTNVAVLNETQVSLSGRLRVEYRVMVMATRQLKWSSVAEVSLAEFPLDKPQARDGRALVNHLAARVADKMGTQLLNNVYPLQVIRVGASGEIYLNQGGNTVQQGARYQVFSQGAEMFDPYTNELLGREEVEIGEAEVVRVNPKFSIARMLNPDVPAAAGMLFRPMQTRRSASASEKPVVTKVRKPAW